MRKPILLMFLLFASILSLAQDYVNVSFTSNTTDGLYCPFTTVNATNVTRGWTETLSYPDTVLVLANTVGLSEHKDKAFHLGDAFPNPFKGETYAFLELSEDSDVLLQLIRVDGVVVASRKLHLAFGTSRITVRMSAAHLAFLSATTNYGRQVVKLINMGRGTTDALDVDFVSTTTKSLDDPAPIRLNVTGEFEPGDLMRYEAQLLDGGSTLYSSAVTQALYGDEIVTLLFDLAQPIVRTNSVTEITQTSAICGGNVTDAGGLMVMARGVCWGTQHNPTVSGSHTSDGMGVGEFTSHMAGLTAGRTYYVRAYAVNRLGTSYGNEMSFATEQIQNYTISLSANPNNGGTVTGGGSYQQGQSCTVHATANTGYTFVKWTENGTQVSTNANYIFTVTGNRTLVAQFQVHSHTITATANPANGGLVTGGGTYDYGQTCTVTASPGTGYNFVNWTENGTQVSSSTSFNFTVTSNRTLVANFVVQVTLPTVTTNQVTNISQTTAIGGGNVTSAGNGTITERGICWSTSHNPTVSNSHTSNGTGTGSFTSSITNLTSNTTYYVRAYATNSAGTAYGSEESFTTSAPIQAPIGAINGLFTINANGDQVFFSQGNLQYKASNNTWRFATNQYDYVGSANSNISSSYSGWIDLFGWGTSGYHYSGDPYNVNYQPWSTSCDSVNTTYNYYGYGPSTNMSSPDLTGSSSNYDWGYYNAISNGGNQTNQWRTLSNDEWGYVLNTRSTSSGIRYAKAQVNNVNGVILLPDNWSSSYYTLYSTNQSGASFSSNVISSTTWANSLESHGAVFLPAAGDRYGTSVYNVGGDGDYWSASCDLSYSAWGVFFSYYYLITDYVYYRYNGRSVRLVCPAQ